MTTQEPATTVGEVVNVLRGLLPDTPIEPVRIELDWEGERAKLRFIPSPSEEEPEEPGRGASPQETAAEFMRRAQMLEGLTGPENVAAITYREAAAFIRAGQEEPEVEPVAEEPSTEELVETMAEAMAAPHPLTKWSAEGQALLRRNARQALAALRPDQHHTKPYDPAAKCTCGHTAHWHGQEIGDPEGTGECEFRLDCGCKKFSLDHTKTDERSSKEGK